MLRVLTDLKALLEGWVSSYCHTDLEPFVEGIDQELKTRLGIFSHLIGWKEQRISLSEKQLVKSGIQSIGVALELQRKKIDPSQREIFSGLWAKGGYK